LSSRHDHGHDHSEHSHDDTLGQESVADAAADLTVADADLSPAQRSRRSFLTRMGLLGVAAGMAGIATPFAGASQARAATSALAGPSAGAAASDLAGGAPESAGDVHWLSGDHHIHTQYSPDGLYRVMQQVEHAELHGLDWMVVTDHGGVDHQKYGVDMTYPDVVASRAAYPEMLVFQGLEWNIPSAEHGTVFVAPGAGERDVLKMFEGSYDGTVNGWGGSSAGNESHALDGLLFLRDAVAHGSVDDALFLANHPARKGLDSPHEIRNWRDTAPEIAVGMEGAPGHQAAGIISPLGTGAGRGFYDNSPSANSFAAYPLESYLTHGGFDWMTAKVGGLWDSLLAEGKGWWISANSDSHTIWRDSWNHSGSYTGGKWADPTDTLASITSFGDFAPGQYSRTIVGARRRSYRAVMEAIRAGRVWVSHGEIIRSLRVTVTSEEDHGATLGGTLVVRQGDDVTVRITVGLNPGLNANGDAPRLRRIDLIAGAVTGPTTIPDAGITTGPDANRDGFSAPGTAVVRQWDISATSGQVELKHTFRNVDGPFYLRVRGTDANVGGVATANDPTPPRMDPIGNSNPWADLWFYANPVFITTR
jgi:hypothetical protein